MLMLLPRVRGDWVTHGVCGLRSREPKHPIAHHVLERWYPATSAGGWPLTRRLQRNVAHASERQRSKATGHTSSIAILVRACCVKLHGVALVCTGPRFTFSRWRRQSPNGLPLCSALVLLTCCSLAVVAPAVRRRASFAQSRLSPKRCLFVRRQRCGAYCEWFGICVTNAVSRLAPAHCRFDYADGAARHPGCPGPGRR